VLDHRPALCREGHPGLRFEAIDEVGDRALAVALRGLLACRDRRRLELEHARGQAVHQPRRGGAGDGAAEGVSSDRHRQDLRRERDGFATCESLFTSMPCRLAAPTIFWRARSLAVALWNSVWFQRAMALRIWASSLIGRCSSPFRSTYANWLLRSLSRSRSRSVAIRKPPCRGSRLPPRARTSGYVDRARIAGPFRLGLPQSAPRWSRDRTLRNARLRRPAR